MSVKRIFKIKYLLFYIYLLFSIYIFYLNFDYTSIIKNIYKFNKKWLYGDNDLKIYLFL